ncbi:choice-of-anchor D domain-containing protein [Micromonospora sp. KC213]|uniref:choice-of-anchor D domain-containing protein n=1 Tax=Micromonospora sp. KC213 TaxID=2530378 RepID=UPI00104B8A02|nr:choice-of-anchor D domain-containing protein [Micromonospora sp. KC213]TDC44118.1 choice-of-anchor D domain-containing protein [Micromonospora sp. KC213]
MRRIRSLLSALVVGTCATAALPGVALAAPAAPYTVLTVDVGNHTGGYPLSQSGVYDTTNATVSVTPSAQDRLAVRASQSSSYVDLSIGPPTGQTWQEGQSYPAARFADATTASLDLNSDHRGCGHSSGSITVREVGRNAETGLVDRFAASYEYSCVDAAGSRGVISGELRWNSGLDYGVAHGTPNPVGFGYQELAVRSAAKTVTFRSVGTKPITFGAASIGGPTPAAFSVLSSQCTGRTLAPGETCTVSVATHPTKAELQTGSLLLADDSSSGTRRVQLSVEGFRGVTGTYYPLSPKRLMDTRSGLGAPKAKIGTGRKVDLQVAGRGGVPSSGVGSVVLNVTVTNPTSSSFLTLYPAGVSRPTASSINFPRHWLGSNNVTVKLGSGGKVSVYNHAGYTDVVVDVVGFYAANNSLSGRGMGGQYHWVKPFRLFDTRTDGGVLPAGYYIRSWVNFGQYNSNIRALVLNITAVSPRKAGFLSAWSTVGDVPTSSTVNYAAGKVVPNLAFVETSPCYEGCGSGYGVPQFGVYTSQTTHMVVDLVGVIDDGTVPDGLRFTPMSPTRIADSRSAQGIPGALGPNATRTVTAPPSMVTDATEVLAMNVTAVSPTNNTVLTVWPADYDMPRPSTSNLNPVAGQTVSNAVMGVIGPQDGFHVHNHSGTTHVVADVVGTFWLYPGTATPTRTAGVAAADTDRVRVLGSGVGAPVRG